MKRKYTIQGEQELLGCPNSEKKKYIMYQRESKRGKNIHNNNVRTVYLTMVILYRAYTPCNNIIIKWPGE